MQAFCFVQTQNQVQVLDRGTGGAFAKVVEAGCQHETFFIAGDCDLHVIPAGKCRRGEEPRLIARFFESDQRSGVVTSVGFPDIGDAAFQIPGGTLTSIPL